MSAKHTQVFLLVAALIVGVALRVWWIHHANGFPRSDAKIYFAMAKKLAATGTYEFQSGRTAFWPIGYPAALSLVFRAFGSTLAQARAFNLILGGATLLCVYFAALGVSR